MLTELNKQSLKTKSLHQLNTYFVTFQLRFGWLVIHYSLLEATEQKYDHELHKCTYKTLSPTTECLLEGIKIEEGLYKVNISISRIGRQKHSLEKN